MKLLFLLLFSPYIIFAQNFTTESLKQNEEAIATNQSKISILKNKKIKLGLGTGKYNINSIAMEVEDQNTGNVFCFSLSTPINSHFSTGYIFQFMRQVAKSEIEPDFVEDIMYSQALNLECSLFGSQHAFDIGALISYGFSSGSYLNRLSNEIIDFSGFMPSFKIFGVMRLNKKIWVNNFLKSPISLKPIEITFGPQIAANNSNGIIRNIWTLSLSTILDFQN